MFTFLLLFFTGLIDPYYESESHVVDAKWNLTHNSGIVIFSLFLFLMLIVGFLFYVKFKLETQDTIYMVLGKTHAFKKWDQFTLQVSISQEKNIITFCQK